MSLSLTSEQKVKIGTFFQAHPDIASPTTGTGQVNSLIQARISMLKHIDDIELDADIKAVFARYSDAIVLLLEMSEATVMGQVNKISDYLKTVS